MSKDRSFALIQGLVGGLLAGVGFSESGVVLMPLGLAFLWASSRWPIAAALWGGVAVLVSHRWLLALHPLNWIGIPAALSLPIATFIWLFCGMIGAVLVAVWAFLGHFVFVFFSRDLELRTKISFVFLMSSFWGLSEVLLARLPLFWIGVGGSLLQGNALLAGLARWLGAGGLATIQLVIGWWLWRTAIAFKRGFGWRKLLFVGLLSLFLAHFLGWNLLFVKTASNPNPIPIALWQPSVPIREKFSNEQQNQIPYAVNDALFDAKELGAEILVAPEGTLKVNQKLLNPAALPLLAGGFRWEDGGQRSSILVFDRGESSFSAKLDKHRLVPLGEWVPRISGVVFKGLSAVGGIQPGPPSRLLSWSGPSLAGAICYELSDGSSLAKAVSDGAQWILAIANLDPYPLLLQKQYLSLARLRAIETSRDLVSVANTGPSSLITASGVESLVVRPFTEGIGLVDLHLYNKSTGYLRWGEVPLLAAFLISLILLVISRR